jgi:hypothetical protein
MLTTLLCKKKNCYEIQQSENRAVHLTNLAEPSREAYGSKWVALQMMMIKGQFIRKFLCRHSIKGSVKEMTPELFDEVA